MDIAQKNIEADTEYIRSDSGIFIKNETLGLIAFAFVLFDSLFVYFLNSAAGISVPVNALLPILILIMIFNHGLKTLPFPPFVFILGLGMLYLSMLVGIITIPNVNITRFFPLTSTLCAFYIGFYVVQCSMSEKKLVNVFLFIGLLYSLTCVIALLKIFPPLFPIIETLSYKNGVLHIKPEITTDQNFQVFYLFPAILVLALPSRPIRFVLAGFCLVSGLFILSQLQTRSGTLVLMGVVICCCLAPLKVPSLGRVKVIVFPILMVVLIVLSMPVILDKGAGLIERFSSGNYTTFQGRILSVKYLFVHLFDPEWWIPQGNDKFLRLTGNVPHSNPTAFFLEGGLIGFVSWLWIFFLPLSLGFVRLMRNKLDNLGTVFLIGGLASFITQLSLNIPLYEQVWLWAGVTIGLLKRYRI